MATYLGQQLPERVKIVEVGPRDGLQNESKIISTSAKVEFVKSLANAGLRDSEAAAFVHPKAVPQMADSAEVLAQLSLSDLPKDVRLSALVPNVRGLERAQQSGIQRVAVFTAASSAFTEKNIRMTVDDSLKVFAEVTKEAISSGLSVRGYVSTVWHCPYAGKVDVDAAYRVTSELFAMGCDEVSLGDTIGKAVPTEVDELLSVFLFRQPVWRDKLALHCHDTYDTALTNIVTGLCHGITTIDSSAGGLGGCPYAPGASGNVATETVLHALKGMGIQADGDETAIAEAAKSVLR
jgi:hydroxymethylglutaryl-CoA lyase